MQELKKLEMQDQDNSDAIDKILERIGMFPNLPTVFDGLTQSPGLTRVAHKFCGRCIVKLRPAVPLSAPRSRSR